MSAIKCGRWYIEMPLWAFVTFLLMAGAGALFALAAATR